MSEDKKPVFVFATSSDLRGAPVHRYHVTENVHSILALLKGGSLELPEGRDVLEFRKEQEDAGVEFKLRRLTTFKEYLDEQDQDTIDKWTGAHPDSVYPVAPAGTFWQEWEVAGEWTVGLLSLEDGQPVEGYDEIIAETKQALLDKSTGVSSAPSAPEGTDEPVADEPESGDAEPASDEAAA